MSVEASGGGASVGSTDRSGGNNVGHEHSIRMDQIVEESSDLRFSEEEKEQFVSFEKASEGVIDKTGSPAVTKPKIPRIRPKLRRGKLKVYFEPKMFTFGLEKYSFKNYFDTADQIKVNLAAKFLQQNGVKKEYLYVDIKKHIRELKHCYSHYLEDEDEDEDDDHDHKFAWMFLVDGCAILQFMYIFVHFRADRELQFRNLGIKFDYTFLLVHDLFLLENQLPYQLLQLIIRHTSKEYELLESIYKFIFYQFRTPFEWYENKREILKDLYDNHVHLLDLLRKKFIQPLNLIDEKRDLVEIIICWIVSLLNKLKCNRNEFDRDWVPFRNIGKLREAGINLKRSKMGDISFSGGTLKLPPIILVESTATMLPNMLAYEMCPDFHNESEVSTYMYILNKLIVQTQDVEELREKNILLNELGSDKEMVELFNEISTYLSPDLKRYDEVKSNIENYFDNKGLIWLHKVFHDIHQYFKGRWSLLAFIGALLAVISSIFQTVITFLAYQADSKKGI
ncbi:hypothetical protein LWI29_015754 [Acer saccharum]|uniref:Uncharacterized protein n=1 Tax=Acer saccharum TaxID=4024 RepID=A0AA39STS9_ACESA|nr:hypothetical protein LWI29_015754 [Acer saccharum]